ncbi:hypothetical protein RI844_05785 [Thalassotalea fonticola]|uniref:Uncharacterized protein n=1 Tax=Thalassotalea fonticola TaxID=3065649 RepID=A0ABZ0GSP2_9GAMM|nr:hypothetical protein RI844_05785 [Colwelliaceae bacterium S1-1]
MKIFIKQPNNNKIALLKTIFCSLFLISASTTATAGQVILFNDDFESGDFVSGGWSVIGDKVSVTSSAAYNDSAFGVKSQRGADFEKVINTAGYSELDIRYVRKTENLTGAENLQVEWSYDGTNWTVLENTQASDWEAESFSVPTDAGDQFHLRFNLNSNKRSERAFVDDVEIIGDEDIVAVVNPDVVTADWGYNGAGQTSLVAAAQVSGSYAVADQSNNIELRDIRQTLQHSISSDDIQAALPNADLTGDNGVCSLALSPSGRQLFVGICAGGSATDKDAILAFNTNTEALTVFDQLTITETPSATTNYDMVYFRGELLVGTDNGLYRFDASKNAVADGVADQPIAAALVPADSSVITGLTVDMIDQNLYLSTPNTLYRADLNQTLTLESVATAANISAISFARSYGGDATGGLYVLTNDANFNSLLNAQTTALRAGGSVTLNHYTDFTTDIVDIAATAEGRMLLAGITPKMMSDTSDIRMDFDVWLADELNQYVGAIKSLVGSSTITGTNSLVPEGFLTRKIVGVGETVNDTPIADNVGWALFLLMAADQVSPDADIESVIDLLIQRHAGLHPDGLGGVKTVDGHFMRNYVAAGTPDPSNPQPQVYISMKFIPAVYKAVELYPNNANFKAYKEYLRQTMKRGSDTIRAEQRITWENDDHGPILLNNKMTNETWIYGDLAAAQDPLATQDYHHYVYSRTNMNYNEWLINEPVILPSHSAFIIMGGSMILRHHFEDPNWRQQNKNYYAVTMAAGDDLGAPYYAAFSAGNNPFLTTGSYYNDGPSDHPGDIIHFPAVLGLGQLGWTAPVVGGYQAYRDGLRQEIFNGSGGDNFAMITRWAMQDPSYVMPSVGLADFWYGAMGLMETIQPGVMNTLRDEFYRPEVHETTSSAGNVELHYSKITPRRVIGVDALGNETSYGFQLSPFEFSPAESFASFKVVDPEGELLELNDVVSSVARFENPNFENGLTGWTKTGDYKFFKPNIGGVSIVGTSAEIRTNPTVTDTESSLSQTLGVANDLDNTRYIVRANGFLATTGAPGRGFLRVQWDNDADVSNGIISMQTSNLLDDNNQRVEFLINTQKPMGANYMHLSFVVEKVAAIYHRYIFDDLSVVRIGADTPIANGDFEDGMTAWNESAAQINLTTESSEVLQGATSLKFSVGPGVTSWKKLSKELDVANDPLGTRYIFRLDTKVITMTDSDFEILIDTYDALGNKIISRRDVGDIIPTTDGEIAFTFRKRPNDDHYVITFRMKRNSTGSLGTDEIIIDNFRLDKEQLF